MLTVEQVRQRLSDHNIRAVAHAIGVHENALYRFMKGETDPRVSTLVKLNEYINNKEQAHGSAE